MRRLTLHSCGSHRALLSVLLCCLLIPSVFQQPAGARSGRRAPTEPRQTPPPDALGIRIGMSQKEARGRLEKVGRLLKEERKRQEVWALDRDPHFASMILGFDGEYRVRYVTLAARAGGAGRMRYSDVADVKGAQQTVGVNNYKYTWRVAARGGDRPGYVVVARGTDPQYLSYFSIKKIE